jgi:hypothetical protein
MSEDVAAVHPPPSQGSGHCPPKSPDIPVPLSGSSALSIGRMTQAKLTDEITVKLQDGFRARLDRIAAQDRRKPGQWARKILEEAVDRCEHLNGLETQDHPRRGS